MANARLTIVKNARKEGMVCETCRTPIARGDGYGWWKFRFGGRHIRCMKHLPEAWERESNSKRQALMQASEAVSMAMSTDDFESCLTELESAIGYVQAAHDEFDEAVQAWEYTNLAESQMKYDFEQARDDLYDWISSAEQWQSDLESSRPDEDEDEDDGDYEDDPAWYEIRDSIEDVPDVDF